MRNHGFTLIELMITIVVASIMLAIAIPSFQSVIQNNRAATFSSDFVAGLNLARSEAVKRGTTVTVCAASNANQNACGGVGDWNNGWIVFVDPNDDGDIAAATDRIKVSGALTVGNTITAGLARITFDGTGFLSTNASAFTLVASGCTGNHGRQVSLSNTGRVSVAAAACT